MASRKHHELYFKVDNRVAVSMMASNTRWRTAISAEGVAPSVGACGTGKEEDGVGGVWIT